MGLARAQAMRPALDAGSGEGFPVGCRCCPDGVSRSSRVPCYPSDMSDAEWAVTEPTLPGPAWKQGRGGRPGEHCRRDIVDAIRYLVKEGIQWRAMPADLPPWSTVYDYLAGWQASGATAAMHDGLREQCRVAAGRSPGPTAAVIDSQSVKAAETVARPGRGFDAANHAGRAVMPGWLVGVGAGAGQWGVSVAIGPA
jgi:transposase